MPKGTIRYSNANRYYYSYQSPTAGAKTWYAASNNLLDSGTYGFCAPGL